MNRMIALWAHPRSRSTVLERVFIERGDFEVFHEPFAHVAFNEQSAIPHDDLDCGLPTTYEGVRELLRSARQRRNVFHKDMCYHCLDELKADGQFLLEHQHVFIIREPARAIVSHFQVFAEMSLHAVGHQALYEIFCRVTKLTGKIPYVIDGDDLARRPDETVRKLCDHLQLEFLPHAMRWEIACPDQWKAWRRWHKEAEQSTHIRAGAERLDDDLLTAHPHLMAYYQVHRPFYERMNQFVQQGHP
ncbi:MULTISPECIES: sulfotransferase family protein [unclassified Pseudomonas]|uniref:sulfotransferase-like domain-containing protein n=1 Tax=unclassified Pseudomonas TaxID=196821 RepID=UPI000D3A3FFA|nr:MULTISPECIES: sulfotransferase family protein [unclassified Pseudomonas]RAU47322.1 sulfotransferase family protein [Pseudomonas sp. RIT 409]RAU52004.1 sulfotransferase family protein [Pseudomonas sp. RIT 412]